MLRKKLMGIQGELKAPKSQVNTFAKNNYKYRNLEDICEALKPLLIKHDVSMTISYEIINFGERFYVKATARLFDDKHEIIATAFARESLTKKGMDESQITGASSSYARKYCLNGLFLIDDTKDADSMDNTKKTGKSDPFLEEMKGYATHEKDIYWKVLGQNGFSKATDIPKNKRSLILEEMAISLSEREANE